MHAFCGAAQMEERSSCLKGRANLKKHVNVRTEIESLSLKKMHAYGNSNNLNSTNVGLSNITFINVKLLITLVE